MMQQQMAAQLDQMQRHLQQRMFGQQQMLQQMLGSMPPQMVPNLPPVGHMQQPIVPAVPGQVPLLPSSRTMPDHRGSLSPFPSCPGAAVQVELSSSTREVEVPCPGRGECIICMDGSATHACIPCGHQVLCRTCSELYGQTAQNKSCPVCRKALLGVYRIYAADPTPSSSEAPSERPAEASAVDPLQQLLNMGFDTEKGRAALASANGSLEMAVAILVSQEDIPRAPPPGDVEEVDGEPEPVERRGRSPSSSSWSSAAERFRSRSRSRRRRRRQWD